MKEYNCIIGIDFGVNGGIAINADGRTVVSKMPKDISAIGEFLQFYKETYNPICFVEKLSIRTDDLTGGKVFRIRRMIANQEGIKAIISLAGVDFCEVHPLTWTSLHPGATLLYAGSGSSAGTGPSGENGASSYATERSSSPRRSRRGRPSAPCC